MITVMTESADRARAIGVETVVFCEKGRWVVEIVVVMTDGVVRERVGTYTTEAVARLTASYVRRGADRDIAGPVNG